MSKKITVSVGAVDLGFNVTDEDFNQYINEQMPNDKVNAAYNFLSRAVDEKSKDDFKSVALSGTTPKGLVVMQIVQVVGEKFGAGVSVSLKKSKESQTA